MGGCRLGAGCPPSPTARAPGAEARPGCPSPRGRCPWLAHWPSAWPGLGPGLGRPVAGMTQGQHGSLPPRARRCEAFTRQGAAQKTCVMQGVARSRGEGGPSGAVARRAGCAVTGTGEAGLLTRSNVLLPSSRSATAAHSSSPLSSSFSWLHAAPARHSSACESSMPTRIVMSSGASRRCDEVPARSWPLPARLRNCASHGSTITEGEGFAATIKASAGLWGRRREGWGWRAPQGGSWRVWAQLRGRPETLGRTLCEIQTMRFGERTEHGWLQDGGVVTGTPRRHEHQNTKLVGASERR